MRMRKIRILLPVLLIGLMTAVGQTGYYIPSERFSSGLINDLCQDQYGYMWIATDYGLNKFDGYRFTTYLNHEQDTTTIGNNVVDYVFCDRDGQLWVGTSRGLDRFDYATGQFIHYPFPRDRQPRVTKITQLKDGRLMVATSGYRGLYFMENGQLEDFLDGDMEMRFVNSVFEDSKGRIWQCGFSDRLTMRDHAGQHRMTTTQGFTVDFAERGDEILIFCLHGIHSYRYGNLTVADIDMSSMEPTTIIRNIYKDSHGNIYIGTRGEGLFRLPAGSNRLERVESITQDMSLNTAKIWAITEDQQGNIWLGCQSKGLVMLPAKTPQFQAWNFAAQGIRLGSAITSVCEGDEGIVWCTVQGNGVFGFDRQGRVVAHPSAPASAECIFRDRQKRYWLGTGDAVYSYNPLTGQATRQMTFDCDKVNAMTDDAQGNLYVSTFSRGFCIFNPETHAVQTYTAPQEMTAPGHLCNNWVMSMITDSQGLIWMATASGVSCFNPKTDDFLTYKWNQLLMEILCYSLCETNDGQILIGTERGLYSYTPGESSAVPFGENDGLRGKVICSIVQAAEGDIWCATSMGIWQYDQKKKTFIGHVNGNGLTSKEYINSVGIHTSDDLVCFANNNGLTAFHPSEVTGSHTELPDVRLTGFYIADNAISTLADHYSVSYLDNAVSLEFSLLDYNNPANIIYEYRIGDSKGEGTWRQNPEGQNAIMLNHLQPGTYNIEVRALAAGIYSKSTTITLEVTPPWYRSTLAYAIYLIALIGLIGLMGYTYRRRANRQLDEEKMKFLINATHDIRSPLTLIMGAVNKLKTLKIEELAPNEIANLKSQISNPVDAIDRNAQRLMMLVNQILDERRIDKNQLQLHCRETNMTDFISGICKLYQFGANQRNITFTFEHTGDHVLAWIDRINFDKVVSNLLSNAFKYTFDGGEVKVMLSETEKDVMIQVIDNGVGIKNEDPDRLFDRFYQGRNSDDLGMKGTGIGLNLCRVITQMHGGQIRAGNRTDGQQGAVFTVTLLKGNKHLKPEQIVNDSPAREVLSEGTGGKKPFRRFRLLVVDDDREIADYIIGELGNFYKFEHAPNGKEALKMLLTASPEHPYDLVISDVMMPEMDGITMLKRIKDNPQISQLPVIMLTSKAEVEHKLEGLKSGADAYIAKPFDMEELHIQIDNLIDSVRRLRGKFSGAVKQEQRTQNIEVKGNDDVLMERIMRSVNANIQDPDFNVDTLAADVGISRAQLHRKMKDITGISTGKFLRNLRMEQAARLLREGTINVSQVADSVGYTDQAHFSTAFKAHFGVSPSEYAASQKDQ